MALVSRVIWPRHLMIKVTPSGDHEESVDDPSVIYHAVSLLGVNRKDLIVSKDDTSVYRRRYWLVGKVKCSPIGRQMDRQGRQAGRQAGRRVDRQSTPWQARRRTGRWRERWVDRQQTSRHEG